MQCYHSGLALSPRCCIPTCSIRGPRRCPVRYLRTEEDVRALVSNWYYFLRSIRAQIYERKVQTETKRWPIGAYLQVLPSNFSTSNTSSQIPLLQIKTAKFRILVFVSGRDSRALSLFCLVSCSECMVDELSSMAASRGFSNGQLLADSRPWKAPQLYCTSRRPG